MASHANMDTTNLHMAMVGLNTSLWKRGHYHNIVAKYLDPDCFTIENVTMFVSYIKMLNFDPNVIPERFRMIFEVLANSENLTIADVGKDLIFMFKKLQTY